MSKLTLHIIRNQQDKLATRGVAELYVDNTKVFTSHTIENTQFIVALGDYDARWTQSPRFTREATARARKINKNAKPVPVFTWEILGVLDGTRLRAGIRIHPVNFSRDLLGCVALGMSVLDLDKDGNFDIGRSREAMRLFEESCGSEKSMRVKFFKKY